MEKKYTSKTTLRAPRPRSRRLREAGIGGTPSVPAGGGGWNGSPSFAGHWRLVTEDAAGNALEEARQYLYPISGRNAAVPGDLVAYASYGDGFGPPVADGDTLGLFRAKAGGGLLYDPDGGWYVDTEYVGGGGGGGTLASWGDEASYTAPLTVDGVTKKVSLAGHTHAWGGITGKPSWIGDTKPGYSWPEITGKPSWIGDTKPGYSWPEITGKPSWIGDTKPGYSWPEITGKPSGLVTNVGVKGSGNALVEASFTGGTLSLVKGYAGGWKSGEYSDSGLCKVTSAVQPAGLAFWLTGNSTGIKVGAGNHIWGYSGSYGTLGNLYFNWESDAACTRVDKAHNVLTAGDMTAYGTGGAVQGLPVADGDVTGLFKGKAGGGLLYDPDGGWYVDPGYAGGTEARWGAEASYTVPLTVDGVTKNVSLAGHTHAWGSVTGTPAGLVTNVGVSGSGNALVEASFSGGTLSLVKGYAGGWKSGEYSDSGLCKVTSAVQTAGLAFWLTGNSTGIKVGAGNHIWGYSGSYGTLGNLYFNWESDAAYTRVDKAHNVLTAGDVTAYGTGGATQGLPVAGTSSYGLAKYDGVTIKANDAGQLYAAGGGGGAYSSAWGDITGKPAGLVTNVSVTGSGNALVDASFSGGTLSLTKGNLSAAWDGLTGKPANLVTNVGISGSGNALVNASFTGGTLSLTKGNLSAAWGEITGKPSWIGSSKPSYSWGEITGKPSWIGSSKPSYSWGEITGKPSWIGSSKPSYNWGEIGNVPSGLVTKVNLSGSGNAIVDAAFSSGALTLTKGSISAGGGGGAVKAVGSYTSGCVIRYGFNAIGGKTIQPGIQYNGGTVYLSNVLALVCAPSTTGGGDDYKLTAHVRDLGGEAYQLQARNNTSAAVTTSSGFGICYIALCSG